VSTIHKAKGLEFDTVTVCADFPDYAPSNFSVTSFVEHLQSS